MKRTIILISVILSFSTLAVFVQPVPRQRTEEFEKLNVFVGKWQAKGKVYPGEGIPAIETKGEDTFKWAMGKTWLIWSKSGRMFMGYGLMTWDEGNGDYAFYWFDNFLTRPSEYHGNWLDEQTLAFKGIMHIRGSKILSKITWRIDSENKINVIQEVADDGKEYRLKIEATYIKMQ